MVIVTLALLLVSILKALCFMPKRRPQNRTSGRTSSKSDAGVVRIIAGQYRGRRLPVLSVDGLRPTGDRVRETVFNWLQNDVPGARCLDAFAGTGALGFEAASRYAETVTLVESDVAAAQALEKSQTLMGASSVDVVNQSFEAFVATMPAPFDLVFVDPPFQCTDYTAVLAAVESVLSPNGLVYIECPKTMPEADAELPAAWSVRRDKNFGDVRARLCGRLES